MALTIQPVTIKYAAFVSTGLHADKPLSLARSGPNFTRSPFRTEVTVIWVD